MSQSSRSVVGLLTEAPWSPTAPRSERALAGPGLAQPPPGAAPRERGLAHTPGRSEGGSWEPLVSHPPYRTELSGACFLSLITAFGDGNPHFTEKGLSSERLSNFPPISDK